MKTSTFTCDNCETPIDPEKVHTITVTSPAIDGGTKTVHLDGSCFEDFMDGAASGADLFLSD